MWLQRITLRTRRLLALTCNESRDDFGSRAALTSRARFTAASVACWSMLVLQMLAIINVPQVRSGSCAEVTVIRT